MKAPFKYLVTDVNKKIKQSIKILEDRLGKNNKLKIKVEYSLNSVNALGTCKYSSETGVSTLKLNPALLNELKDKYINEVVVHEVAHAAVNAYIRPNTYRRVMPHGKEFKQMCRILGISGAATTKIAKDSKILNSKKKKRATVTYKCDCQTHELSKIRHNRIQKGEATYSCRTCRTKLVKA